MNQRGFYRPDGAWIGDVIPYEQDGTFHLFYLHETRRRPAEGMPWHLITTEDGVSFAEHGVALASGGPSSDDFNVYTGSIVLDDDGVHHMFYTGQNPERRGADGLPLQLVMHATSTDGMTSWQRHPEDTFGAGEGYVAADWRDPFVFRDPETGLWRMLITTGSTEGPSRRRGVVAQCTSTDLRSWRPAPAFWAPHRALAYECPEVFQWGEWWHLVVSEFTDAFTTRYRMSRSLDGPWIVPEHDSLDGRAFYAAKSAARDGRRLFFGWISTREGDVDDGAWQWAGTLSVLEAEQRPDGTLAFHPTAEQRDAYGEGTELLPSGTVLSAPDGYAELIADGTAPAAFRLVARFDVDETTRECGVLLRAGADGDDAYVLRLEPRRNRLVFDRWPRRQTGTEQWQISGDVPFVVELERPVTLGAGSHVLDVIVDGDICVATVNDEVVLSTRLYDRASGRVGAFVGEGTATLRSFTLSRPADDPDTTDTTDPAQASPQFATA
ncbi:GH32 C-terminal domain-containing protein [Mycetocola reblochoni]|uniref:GH32 C-terminal domain-containing protein n=1 Tax=Mycetocola reblochoni TaxID=331618 RepID=UPI003F960579